MISIAASTELFNLGGFSVQTWGTIVAIGIIIGTALMIAKARKIRLSEKAGSMLVDMMLSGLICGRLAYIAVNFSEFKSFFSYFSLWDGGIISWGVLIGIIIGIFIFKIISKINTKEILEIVDLMAPYLILAIAIGRIGCFLRGCCFGLPTELPWAVVYSGADALAEGPVHPTQIYHSILDFIIFFILIRVNKKKELVENKKLKSRFGFFSKKGSGFLMFIMLYSMERFFIDFLRFHPANEYIGVITVTQFVFIFLFALAFGLIIKTKTR